MGKTTLRVRYFKAEDLLPSCLHCSKPIHLDGQSQGWTHNACAPYPEHPEVTRAKEWRAARATRD